VRRHRHRRRVSRDRYESCPDSTVTAEAFLGRNAPALDLAFTINDMPV